VIPLRDLNPVRRTPVVTWALIGINVAVWLYQVGSGAPVIERFGIVPEVVTGAGGLDSYWRLVTSMFVHAGWLHLLGNVWFLHVFGDNVEDELGRGPFAAFYLASGLAAAATHVAIDPASPYAMVGASGAIAGVLGAYLVLHPRARVVALVVVVFAELPAWIFLFVWFGLQLVHGLGSLGSEPSGGVAFFAHVGGFVAGLAMMFVLRGTEPPQEPQDEAQPKGLSGGA